MTPSEFEKAMSYALEAYLSGYPVVVFSSENIPLHGHDFLRTVTQVSITLDAFFVKGVPLALWNSSEYPYQLECARKYFMEGKQWPQRQRYVM